VRARPTSAVYFGSSVRLAETINRSLPLSHIYVEKRHFNRDIFNLSRFLSIPFSGMETRADLAGLNPGTGAVGISYGVGVIFKNAQIVKFEHGIWNIHTGKLPNNRGRHPISWSFLNNERELFISIHQINEQIDQGKLLAEASYWRSMNDTQAEVEQKYLALLEGGLFEKAIANYVEFGGTDLAAGTYLPSLAGTYSTVDPTQHDALFLFNLFKAQAVYGGVTVAGRKFTVCDFVNDDRPETYEGYEIFTSRDGHKIGLK
jgi:Formyl transferase